VYALHRDTPVTLTTVWTTANIAAKCGGKRTNVGKVGPLDASYGRRLMAENPSDISSFQ